MGGGWQGTASLRVQKDSPWTKDGWEAIWLLRALEERTGKVFETRRPGLGSIVRLASFPRSAAMELMSFSAC